MVLVFARFTLLCLVLCIAAFPSSFALAAGWTVTVQAHRIEALTNSDNWGEQDLYWQAHLKATVGSGGPASCSTVNNHADDDNEIEVDWACTTTVAGGTDTTVEIKVEVFDEDTIGDDELDLSVDHNQLGLAMLFEPRTSKLTIIGDPTWPAGQCAFGKIVRSGFGGGGGEPAEIEFTVTASPASAPDGDSDIDGLPDSWEVCGIDDNGDGKVDVDLPALGADPGRKDVFVEIDWMEDRTSAAPHTHAPWLPAMINAWNEMNVAPVTNPTLDGVAKPAGIALHLDTGLLYASYSFDIDGSNPPEFTVGGDGNIELSGDGIPDIGNLGAIGPTPIIGGTALPEDPLLSPPSTVTGTPVAADMFAPGSDFAVLKGARFAPARDSVFHYTVFGHSYTQVQNGPANSSGLAEPCTSTAPCNELMVTLSGGTRQTVDADRNNVPDGVTVINGPGALPVDGLIRAHVGTFLHELGHNFGLGHGGGDSINFKPNYLSIMSYSFQTTGLAYDWDTDLVGDSVGLDFDRDGIQDVRRFQYSTAGSLSLPATLNEGVPPQPFLDETIPISAGSRVLTSHTCPPLPPPPPGIPPPTSPPGVTLRADQTANWNCNGNTTETNVQSDVNNVNFSSGVLESLAGFDDYNFLANGGLDVNPGISEQEQRQRDATTQRILEPPGRQEYLNKCVDPRRLEFEDLPRGTVVRSQFAPDVEFVEDALRTPTVLAPPDRNGVPTASPDHSLANLPRSGAVSPLAFSFRDPQRVVALAFGQAGLSSAPREGTRAVLQAFDQNGLSMGVIVKSLPPPNQGITQLITVAAIFPDQLIQRVELRYEIGLVTGAAIVSAPISEPVQIDDLVFCGRLDDRGIDPDFPPLPKFGDRPATLHVASEALSSLPGSGEPGNTVPVTTPFTGLAIEIDGTPATTATDVTRAEGTTLELEAPSSSSVGPFLYWRYDNGVSFGNGITEIPLTLLRDGTITAVYLGRGCTRGCDFPRDEEQRPVESSRER
jgi:hypothetical protein